MKERKKEKQMFYILILILISFSLNLILIKTKGVSEVFATFSGSLIGALISGLAAIFVMYKSLEHRKKEITENENKNFKKAFVVIQAQANNYFTTVTTMFWLIQSQGGKIKKELEKNLSLISIYRERLDDVNDDYIPLEVYKEFHELKTYFKLTYDEYSKYVSSIELFYGDNEWHVAKENEALKNSILENHKDNKKYTMQRYKCIQEYNSKI